MNKELVTEAFERLGPERVSRGMAAFGEPNVFIDVWERCFLGRAAGITAAIADEPGGIDRALAAAGVLSCWEPVADAYDSAARGELKRLAEEWLELNRRADVQETRDAVPA
jgi:hypothetical protein